MKKSVTNKSQASVKQFVSKNWVSLATLLVSLSVLFASIQSNIISKEANKIAVEAVNAKLRLVTDIKPDDMLIINIFGCYSRVASKYEIVRYITDSATLTNTGGRGTALVAVKFDDGYNRNYSITVCNSESCGDKKVIKFPLQFETSETKPFYLNAVSQFDDPYDQKQLAIQSAEKLNGFNEPSNAVWKFIYADGTIINKEYQKNFYSVSPLFETYLDSECNY